MKLPNLSLILRAIVHPVVLLIALAPPAFGQGSGVRGEEAVKAAQAFIDAYIQYDLETDARTFVRELRIEDTDGRPDLQRVVSNLLRDGLAEELEKPQDFAPSTRRCYRAGKRVEASSERCDRGGKICFDTDLMARRYFLLGDVEIAKRLVATVFHEKAHQRCFEDGDAYLLSGFVRPRARIQTVRRRPEPGKPATGTRLPTVSHPDLRAGLDPSLASGASLSCLERLDSAIREVSRRGARRAEFREYSAEALGGQKKAEPEEAFGIGMMLTLAACALGFSFAMIPGAGWLAFVGALSACASSGVVGTLIDTVEHRAFVRERARVQRYNEALDQAIRAVQDAATPQIQVARAVLRDRQYVYAVLSEARAGSLRTVQGALEDAAARPDLERVRVNLNLSGSIDRLRRLADSTRDCSNHLPTAAELGAFLGARNARDDRAIEILPRN